MYKTVIDIGTNSVRIISGNEEEPSYENISYSRFGEGSNKTGLISEKALERTIDAIGALRKEAPYPEDQLIFTATSALREAKNRAEIQERLEAALGAEIHVLSGEEEAFYAYQGATWGVTGKTLVLDIGGGSTEISWFNGQEVQCLSKKIGAVRFYEDPDSYLPLETYFTDYFEAVPFSENMTLIGTGGTITSLAAMMVKMRDYDGNRIHHFKITLSDVQEWIDKITQMPLTEIPVGLSPTRRDIIVPGLEILKSILVGFKTPVFEVSVRDILWGLYAFYNI